MSNTQLSNQIESTNLGKRILILERLYRISLYRGRRLETKLVCSTKNEPKQNLTQSSSPTNVKYYPRGLMTENKKCKIESAVTCKYRRIVLSGKSVYSNFLTIFMYHALHFPLCISNL